MEMLVAGALFLIGLVPVPADNKAVNSPSLEEIAKNVSIYETSSKPIDISPTKSPKKTEIKATTHVVKAGETLNEISEQYYDSGKYWTTIWNDNPEIEDPRIINAGLELKISDPKPTEVADLNPDLQKIYDEINSPSPTPTPKTEVAGASTQVVPQAGPSNFDEAYRQAGTRFGVPWEILYGLHHMETGGRDGAISSGYGTGAQGPLQFMPGTWASYGIDGNGDGTVDINNAIDAIFGAANYLAAHGGVDGGLRAYGGDSEKAKAYARSRGWNQ